MHTAKVLQRGLSEALLRFQLENSICRLTPRIAGELRSTAQQIIRVDAFSMHICYSGNKVKSTFSLLIIIDIFLSFLTKTNRLLFSLMSTQPSWLSVFL